MTSDLGSRVVIGPRPPPLVLAAPRLMIVVGIAMAAFSFAEPSFGEQAPDGGGDVGEVA